MRVEFSCKHFGPAEPPVTPFGLDRVDDDGIRGRSERLDRTVQLLRRYGHYEQVGTNRLMVGAAFRNLLAPQN